MSQVDSIMGPGEEQYKYRVFMSKKFTGSPVGKTLWLYANSIEEASKGVVDYVIEQGSTKYTFGMRAGYLQDVSTGSWIGRVFRTGLVVNDVKWMPGLDKDPPQNIILYEPKVKRKVPDNSGRARAKAIQRKGAERRKTEAPNKPKKQQGILVWE